MEIVAQLRLLVPLARLTGLLAVAFRFAPATRSAGARGYPAAADAVASSWLLWVARALFGVQSGVRSGVLGSLKSDKHGRRRRKRMEPRVGGRQGAALKFCGWSPSVEQTVGRSTNKVRAVSLHPGWHQRAVLLLVMIGGQSHGTRQVPSRQSGAIGFPS